MFKKLDDLRSLILPVGLALLILVALTGLTWANYRYAVQNPGGNDLLPHWLGTRLFLMQGQSPYSAETTQAVQKMIFGRPARPGEDQSAVAYPFYSIYLFSPFSLIENYDTARAVWMTALEVGIILLVMASIALSRWHIQPVILVALLVFSVLWYHSIRSIINGNAAILCALWIALAFLAIRAGHDGLAGFLLALSTIKPQMVVLLAVFVLFWCISWKRWTLFWGFLGSLGLLIASTSLLIPDWIVQNLRQVLTYPKYTLPGTPGAIFTQWLPGVGSRLGWALTIFLLATLVVEWRAAWRKEFHWFFWTASLTLVATNLIGIRTATDNYLALFPALVLVLATWDQEWGWLGRLLVILSFIGLFFGLWWMFLATIYPLNGQPTQSPAMFFPLPVFLFLTLYWIRWWVLHPSELLLDQLRRVTGGVRQK